MRSTARVRVVNFKVQIPLLSRVRACASLLGAPETRVVVVHTHMQTQTPCSVNLGAENLTLQP